MPLMRTASASKFKRTVDQGYIGNITGNLYDYEDRIFNEQDLADERKRAKHFAHDDARDFAKTRTCTSREKGGYMNEYMTSVFAAEEKMPYDLEAPPMTSVEEFAMCLVSNFPDVEIAYQFFDNFKSGRMTLTEFIAGVRALGFNSKDGRTIFKMMLMQSDPTLQSDPNFPPWKVRDYSVSRKGFGWLWRLGGGTIDPDLKRITEDVCSVTKMMAAAAGPPVIHSYGDFLESSTRTADILSSRDLEDPLVNFAKWAANRWEVLHTLFTPVDHRGMYGGRRKVRAEHFVTFVRGLGFTGNAVRVFSEIKRHGPQNMVYSKAALKVSGLDEVDGLILNETDEISRSQLNQFEKYVMALLEDSKAGEEGNPATRFIEQLKMKHGSVFVAWRADLDIRQTGRLAFNDLCNACKKLGVVARPIWNAYRPDGSPEPLRLSDLAPEESAIVDDFLECLWSNFGFDLDKAWGSVDSTHRQMATMDEWCQGVRRLGFEGDAKMIFLGLECSGLGHMTRDEFDYVKVLSDAGMRQQHSAPPVRAFNDWVQEEFESPEAFLDMVGLEGCKSKFDSKDKDQSGKVKKIGVSDLAARLSALGYPGNAMQVAMIAAKTGGGTEIMRCKLMGLLLGKRRGAPPQKGHLLRTASDLSKTIKTAKSPWRPRKSWTESVDAVAFSNDRLPASVRTYFSVPEKKAGFALSDRIAGVKPRAPDRSVSLKSRSASPKVDTGRFRSASPPGSSRSRSLTPSRIASLLRMRSLTPPRSKRTLSLSPRRRLDYTESGFDTGYNFRFGDPGERFVWGADRASLKEGMASRPLFDNTTKDFSTQMRECHRLEGFISVVLLTVLIPPV
jgi:hypothetical protein